MTDYFITYCGWPDRRDGHLIVSLALKIHSQAHGKDRHAHLSHGICGFATKEPRIYWWTDHNYSPVPLVISEMRQCSLNRGVQPFRIDLLHQHKSLHACLLNITPPYGTTVIDEHIQVPKLLLWYKHLRGKTNCNNCAYLNNVVDHLFDSLMISDIDRDGHGLSASLCNLASHGAHCRLWRIGVWWERTSLVSIRRALRSDCNYSRIVQLITREGLVRMVLYQHNHSWPGR